MKNNLLDLKNLINDEIQLYENLNDLFEDKRQTLIANDVEGLLAVDEKIMKLTGELRNSVTVRTNVCEVLGNGNMTLANMMEMASQIDEELALDFATAKEKVDFLKKSLTTKELVIKELLRHGMTMVSKTLNMISNASSVAGDYNRAGRSVESGIDKISLIVEEV